MKSIAILLLATLGLPGTLFGEVPLTSHGPEFPEIAKAHDLLRAFQEKYKLPGLSLAVSYKNRLIYSASVGYADREAGVALTPSFRMRIASVTKPITAVAVLKLVEAGKLRLDDLVFGEKGLLAGDYGVPLFENAPATLTLRHLLNHSAGGWGNSRNDPMFNPQTLGLDGRPLIEKVLKDFPLTSKPGTKYDYSNFGYYLLGRVIEKAAGQPYEQYVKTAVLAPVGVTGMFVGAPTAAQDEVKYYASGSEDPNFTTPLHMDSHGGWVATPRELLKFLAGIDKFDNSTKLLKEQTINLMVTPSPANNFYGFGFQVNKYNNWWHTGSLPGVSSEIGRASDGYCWAVLVNHRPEVYERDAFSSDLDQLFWRVKEAVRQWPAGVSL